MDEEGLVEFVMWSADVSANWSGVWVVILVLFLVNLNSN